MREIIKDLTRDEGLGVNERVSEEGGRREKSVQFNSVLFPKCLLADASVVAAAASLCLWIFRQQLSIKELLAGDWLVLSALQKDQEPLEAS